MPDRWELANGFGVTLNDSAVDADGDGLSNLQEYALNTNPLEADSDGDGLNDYQEVNDLETDPNEPDSDGDGFDDGVESSTGEDPNDASSYPGDDEYAGRFSEKRSVINAASGWKTSLDGSLSSFGLSGQAIAGIITENATIENRSGWVSTIEVQSQNPVDQDTDGDGLPDVWEKAYDFDPLLADALGDRDGDGLSNTEEFANLTNPLIVDTDADGLSDQAEIELHGTDPIQEDGDGDGYSDMDEIAAGTDANRADRFPGWDFVVVNYQTPAHFHGTAGGWSSSISPRHFSSVGDFRSVSIMTAANISSRTGFLHRITEPEQDYLLRDSDGDGMPDYWEKTQGFDPVVDDSTNDGDEDGLTSIQEFALGTNPLLFDTDEDGLSDGQEISVHGSNPLLKDTDGDGFEDAMEALEGSDQIPLYPFLPLQS